MSNSFWGRLFRITEEESLILKHRFWWLFSIQALFRLFAEGRWGGGAVEISRPPALPPPHWCSWGCSNSGLELRGKNGNDFLHLRAQFTTGITSHLFQAATDSTEHLHKIKQKSFTFWETLTCALYCFPFPSSFPPSFLLNKVSPSSKIAEQLAEVSCISFGTLDYGRESDW